MGHEVLGSVFGQGETKDRDVKNVAERNEVRQQEDSLNNGRQCFCSICYECDTIPSTSHLITCSILGETTSEIMITLVCRKGNGGTKRLSLLAQDLWLLTTSQ